MSQNTQVLIARVPDGPLVPEHFEVQKSPAPVCGEGEVLCRTLALTIGAGQRAGLQGSASYAGAPRAGVVMGGTGVARVEQSNAPGFAPGDLVVGPTGWQALSSLKASLLRRVPAGADPALHLGVLGTNGLTAYFGLLDLGKPVAGNTVVVSAAALGGPHRRTDREARPPPDPIMRQVVRSDRMGPDTHGTTLGRLQERFFPPHTAAAILLNQRIKE